MAQSKTAAEDHGLIVPEMMAVTTHEGKRFLFDPLQLAGVMETQDGFCAILFASGASVALAEKWDDIVQLLKELSSDG